MRKVVRVDFWRQFHCKVVKLTFAIASRQLWGGAGPDSDSPVGESREEVYMNLLAPYVRHLIRPKVDEFVTYSQSGNLKKVPRDKFFWVPNPSTKSARISTCKLI